MNPVMLNENQAHQGALKAFSIYRYVHKSL